MFCILCGKPNLLLFSNKEDDRAVCAKCLSKKDTHLILYPDCQVDWHDSYDRHTP